MTRVWASGNNAVNQLVLDSGHPSVAASTRHQRHSGWVARRGYPSVMDASRLFEAELRQRGVAFRHARQDGRYEVSASTGPVLVSLDNLSRQLRGDDGDVGQVAHFTDVVMGAVDSDVVSPDRLFWSLEPNDFAESAPHRVAVSRRTDRVLTDYAADASWLRWVTPKDLDASGLSDPEAFELAWSHLDVALRGARIQLDSVDGVTIVWLDTDFPSKASLILAPCLRYIVSPHIGWPVLAAAPDRDFVCLWGADRRELIARLGRIVVREYGRASHPLTTEIFEIGEAVQAIGAFPT